MKGPATAGNSDPVPAIRFAVRGRLGELDEADRNRLFDRATGSDAGLRAAVAAIVADVADRGDQALREMAARYDGVELDSITVPRVRWDTALAELDPEVRAALETAASAIRRFHASQLPQPLEVETFPGVRLTRIAEPLSRVGVYAPGGTAAYPSSVLMGVLPAKVAGVSEVVVCSPPGPDGLPSRAVLAACSLAGADHLFALGGAGAVAAMAYGTATVPGVDRIVGPGNAFVAEAKRQLNGTVGIDSPAGPSELLIVADSSAEPETVTLELVAQAEHDPAAGVVLVTTEPELVSSVEDGLARLLPDVPRADVIAAAFAARGGLLLAPNLDSAYEFATRYAPEHLLLLVEDPRAAARKVRAAGTIFLGPASSVAFGDYITGANHVLPTGRATTSFSGLSAGDFLRSVTLQEVSPEAAAKLARPTAALAEAEGLPGHAAAAIAHGRIPAADGPARLAPRLRAAYRELDTYDPGRSPVALDLSDNTNLFGECDVMREAIATLPPSSRSRYPSVYADRLKDAVAVSLGVAPENVVTGCGSDDVLDSAVRAFCETGSRAAYPSPTFGMVPAFARMNAVEPLGVPLRHDLTLDVDGLLDTDADIHYVCRPNNPTGHSFERNEVERLIAGASGIVLIDEAYADFAADDFVAVAAQSDRAIVMRTLSKAFGMAGLRVGFAIGPAELVREVEKSRGPYKVNAVAEHVALAMLERGTRWVRDHVQQVRENRARLEEELERRGLSPVPSVANFVLVRVPGDREAALTLGRRLRGRGVGVRVFADLPVLGSCIRVTIGPWSAMSAFLEALDESGAAGGGA